jgi:acyl carrier protein
MEILMNQKLKNLLSDQFGVPVENLNANTCVVKDLGADSIDIVEVVMNIEGAFKIKIDQEEYQGKSTVAALEELIIYKLSL